MSTMRWNALRREWVVTAAVRQDRTFNLERAGCPFEPALPGDPLTDAPVAYEIAVLQNRFPSFAPAWVADDSVATPLQPVRPANGICEVVLYVADHDATLAMLPVRTIANLIRVWQDRYRVLSARPGVDCVYIFENRGAAVGVTLSHPHGQIYAYPFVPPVFATERDAGAAYRSQTGRCLVCDLYAEDSASSRLVYENDHFSVICPFAGRYPYEAQIVAREHTASLLGFGPESLFGLAQALHGLVTVYDQLFDMPLPYVMAIHQAPTAVSVDPNAHLHIDFHPVNRAADRLKFIAGSEVGAGVYITDVLPEDAAETLRRCWPA